MAKKKIKEIIEEIAFDFMTDNGLELYNVEFLKRRKRLVSQSLYRQTRGRRRRLRGYR